MPAIPGPPRAPATEVVHQRVVVSFDYPVVFTDDVFAPDNDALARTLSSREPTRQHRALVFLDQGVAHAFPELAARIEAHFAAQTARLALVAPPVLTPGGEAAKNDPLLVDGWHALLQRHRMDRHSFVVIVGGGGMLDAVGYAAATCHRGIRTVRVPTTVLGQNDSGVGVKNGINAFGSKNFLGTFVPPFAVINDLRFLERLPRREQIAGLAEAVKVALIRDAAFFDWLEAHADALAACDVRAQGPMIRRCAELHLAHIAGSGDPFELGSARPLDYGHWSAHKLEALTTHAVRHGEAVAIGLLLDARYSFEAGLLSQAELGRIQRLLGRLGLPAHHEALARRGADGRPQVLAGLEEFREHLGGELTVTLLAGIGRGVEVHEMDEAKILASLAWLEAAARRRAP